MSAGQFTAAGLAEAGFEHADGDPLLDVPEDLAVGGRVHVDGVWEA